MTGRRKALVMPAKAGISEEIEEKVAE